LTLTPAHSPPEDTEARRRARIWLVGWRAICLPGALPWVFGKDGAGTSRQSGKLEMVRNRGREETA